MGRPTASIGLLVLHVACGGAAPTGPDRVPVGTWGGDDAALIVETAQAHVHIGCTRGDIPSVIPVAGGGRFVVAGTYNVDAYPVDRGILHPALFEGRLEGDQLTLGVRLTDTQQRLGPVTLFRGRTPQMRNCPICAPSATLSPGL